MKTIKQLIEEFLNSDNKELDLPMTPIDNIDDIMRELGALEDWSLEVNTYGGFYKSYVYGSLGLELSGFLCYGEFKLSKRYNMGKVCGDNRFEIIAKAKEDILLSTNIKTSEDEMKVLDNFLFRCWQMGWLNKYNS
jgi:hypothetical protein